MDWLLLWYTICAFGFGWVVYQPGYEKTQNGVKEWLAQLVASSDPLPDYLYDQEETRPMEYQNADKR
jgi:hypothetical protein